MNKEYCVMLHKKLVTHYHMVIPSLLVFFLALGVVITVNETQKIQEVNSHAAATNCTVTASQLTMKTQEQALLTQVNAYRAQNNLGQLSLDNTLKQSSEWQSLDMAAHNNLSHIDSLNRTPDVRLTNCGYNSNNGYGENIADGPNDPTAIFNAWKNDPPHNQILLTAAYNITGIAMEVNSAGTAYWTMDFGVSTTATQPSPTTITTPTATGTPGTTTPTLALTPTVSASGTPTSTISPSPSLNPNFPTPTTGPISADMQIAVSVNINGIGQGANLNPLHKTRHITALVYDASNKLAATGNAFLNYDGSNYFTGTIHLGKLSQGPYFIKLASDNTLQVLAKPEFQNLKINQINTIPPVTLYQGDMNADNILDINDYNLVLPCFQSIPTCANASKIDFNDDGVTDVKDYNLFLNSFEILHGD